MNKGTFLIRSCFYAARICKDGRDGGAGYEVCSITGIQIVFRFRLLSPMHDCTRPQQHKNAHGFFVIQRWQGSATTRRAAGEEKVTRTHAKQLTRDARFDFVCTEVCRMQDKKIHSDRRAWACVCVMSLSSTP